MNTITTSQSTATTLIQRAQRMISATEGRTLDFETADEINRTLLASIKAFSEAPIIVAPFEQEDFLTDEEVLELEMRISRDHDDSAYWSGGAI